jgi:hypothetical protein
MRRNAQVTAVSSSQDPSGGHGHPTRWGTQSRHVQIVLRVRPQPAKQSSLLACRSAPRASSLTAFITQGEAIFSPQPSEGRLTYVGRRPYGARPVVGSQVGSHYRPT